MKTIVIGGGVIGLSCAYYLQEAGHEVVVVDSSSMEDGASYGNAGHIVPSHFVPLASPGIVSQGIKWMFDSSSPFYIKPRLNLDLLRWGYTFWRMCGEKKMKEHIPPLQQLLSLSRELFEDLKIKLGNSFYMTEKGILILYKKEQTGLHEKSLAENAALMGMESTLLSAAQVQSLENSTTLHVSGGVLYKADAHLHPGLFMKALKTHLEQNGVTIINNIHVLQFEKQVGKIKAIITPKEKIIGDAFILANGAWLPGLTKKLHIPMLMQAGKGYSITYPNFYSQLQYPAILADHRVVTTPIGPHLRIAGTMEINTPGSPVMQKRVDAIINSVQQYYPDLQFPAATLKNTWSGLRPLSPDGLPYIGSHSSFNNLVIAGGHAMLGLSLATGTGKIVQQLVDQQKTAIPIKAFSVERFR